MTLAELQPEIQTREAYDAFLQNNLVKPPTFIHDQAVSNHFNADIFLVSELEQDSGGYKERGVQTWFKRNVTGTATKEVVTLSAGNHAAAVAIAAFEHELMATIFMPANTPEQKIENVRELGGDFITIELRGETIDATAQHVTAYLSSKDEKTKFIHPFDDPDVVSGQGTLGHAILDTIPDVDVIVVPVGGGGLLSGIIHATQASSEKKLHYIAAEPDGAASLSNNLRRPNQALHTIDTFIDGAAVKQVGNTVLKTLHAIGQDNYSVVRLTRSDVQRAVTYFWESHEDLRPELAGALAFAALPYMRSFIRGKKVACLMTGGNLSEERYNEEVRLMTWPARITNRPPTRTFIPKCASIL